MPNKTSKKKRKHPGRPPLPAKKVASRRSKAMDNLRRGHARCSFLTKSGQSCMGAVVETTPDGWSFCNGHRNRSRAGYLEEMKSQVTDKGIDTLLDKTGIGAETGKTPQRAVDAIDQAMGNSISIEELEKKTGMVLRPENTIPNPDARGIVRFKPTEATKHGGSARFAGVDYQYYEGDYKNDHIFLLDRAIYFAYCKLNILTQQLQKIEAEEEQMKKIETYGTQMIKGENVEFSNVTIKHSTPMEVKIKLFDTMTKAESHLSALLKQKESLLVTALAVMRKLNIKFSREAGQMVVAAHEAHVIAQASDATPLPLRQGYILPEKILDKAREEAREVSDGMELLEAGPKSFRASQEQMELAHRLNEENVANIVFKETPDEQVIVVDDDW